MPTNLLSLPRELRHEILSYFIPSYTVIAISPIWFGLGSKSRPSSLLESRLDIAVSCDEFDFPTAPLRRGGNFRERWEHDEPYLQKPAFHIDRAVFLINREISDEARSMLYSTNIFRFEIVQSNYMRPRNITRPNRKEEMIQGSRAQAMVDMSSGPYTPTISNITSIPVKRALHMKRRRNSSRILGLPNATLARLERIEIIFPGRILNSGCQIFNAYRFAAQHITDLLNKVNGERKLKELFICSGHTHDDRLTRWNQFADDDVDNDTCELHTRSRRSCPDEGNLYSAAPSGYQYFLEPFGAIRGIQSVKIAGCVSPGFSSELAAMMMRPVAGGKQESPQIELPRRAYRIEKKPWKDPSGGEEVIVEAERKYFFEPCFDWACLAEEWEDDRFEESRVNKRLRRTCDVYEVRGSDGQVQHQWHEPYHELYQF